MEITLERFQKLENETKELKNELKKEREINRDLQLQIADMNKEVNFLKGKNMIIVQKKTNSVKLKNYVDIFYQQYKFKLLGSFKNVITDEQKKIILLYYVIKNIEIQFIVKNDNNKYKVFKPKKDINDTHFSIRLIGTTFESKITDLENEFIGFLIETDNNIGYVSLNNKYYIIGNYEKSYIRCFITNKLLSNSFEEII